MLKKWIALVVALAAMALFHSAAVAGELSIGDPAPKLSVKKFVKGAPVTQFEKGKIYVVEFWATWCGPCRDSIPHLTQLAMQNRNVTFIGVSVLEQNQKLVAPFVAKMGAKMNYHVAMDAVPAGGDGSKGAMATRWMQAAGLSGIPAAFIIDKESKVAWIGHPMEMEAPLNKIVMGKWDLKAETARTQKEKAAGAVLRDLQAKMLPAYKAMDYAKVVAIMDAAIAKHPEIENTIAPTKITMLMHEGKSDDAADYINKLVDGPLKDNRDMLMQIAWMFANPEGATFTRFLTAAALRAAQRSDELSQGKAIGTVYTLAAAYFANGDKEKAIETQERAIQLAKGTSYEAEFAKMLAKYKAAK